MPITSFGVSLFFALLLEIKVVVVGTDRVDNFVNGYLKKNKSRAARFMVRKNGQLVFGAGYGIANLEHGVRVTPQTVFQSASLGKHFAAMAVMMLVEDHKIVA